jgi:hypothetical protein
VGITFSRLSLSYWTDNLGFITEGKLAAIFIKTFSWGFPIGRSYLLHQLGPIKFSGAIAGDNEEEEEAPTSTNRQQNATGGAARPLAAPPGGEAASWLRSISSSVL